MNLGPIGIWSMELRNGSADQAREQAAELEALGWPTIWLPGLSGTGALPAAEQLLQATTKAIVATGVLGLWSFEPDALAREHHRLQRAYGHRMLTGVGASSPASAAAAGKSFPGAVTAMTDYLDRVDALPDPIPVDERVLAALGPRMSRLAADRARGLHPFLVTPDYVANTRTAIGDAPLIAPHQAVILERDPSAARAAARKGIGMFIGLPSYQANLRRLGFDDKDLIPGGSDRLIDHLVAWGDLDAIQARIAQHHDAGADHVALHVLPSDTGVQVPHAWREISVLLRP